MSLRDKYGACNMNAAVSDDSRRGWQDGGRVRAWQQTTVSTKSRAEVRIEFSDGRTEQTLQMVWKE